ncbi:hypothetical protein VPAG_00019 [Vibrio phage douglas 12A4]|uniref:hypothetical protein n=1 Tax=Vibrio phage douglas 12A4 TaxID=573171 RepID=UPI0002C0FB41|nr:hypothetical protein VPAG_00019 [Vibrio phage douglas 12A4]AGG58055.1 hypothetical protein VPAG_00019 [Vibrio phage douglas 12A4]
MKISLTRVFDFAIALPMRVGLYTSVLLLIVISLIAALFCIPASPEFRVKAEKWFTERFKGLN